MLSERIIGFQERKSWGRSHDRTPTATGGLRSTWISRRHISVLIVLTYLSVSDGTLFVARMSMRPLYAFTRTLRTNTEAAKEAKGMSTQNPSFWEVQVDDSTWANFSQENKLLYESPIEKVKRLRRQKRAKRIVGALLPLMRRELTEKQMAAIQLYYFEGMKQREIAEVLQTSQQMISKYLFGERRNGKKIGGAMNKLRKICSREGIHW